MIWQTGIGLQKNVVDSPIRIARAVIENLISEEIICNPSLNCIQESIVCV